MASHHRPSHSLSQSARESRTPTPSASRRPASTAGPSGSGYPLTTSGFSPSSRAGVPLSSLFRASTSTGFVGGIGGGGGGGASGGVNINSGGVGVGGSSFTASQPFGFGTSPQPLGYGPTSGAKESKQTSYEWVLRDVAGLQSRLESGDGEEDGHPALEGPCFDDGAYRLHLERTPVEDTEDDSVFTLDPPPIDDPLSTTPIPISTNSTASSPVDAVPLRPGPTLTLAVIALWAKYADNPPDDLFERHVFVGVHAPRIDGGDLGLGEPKWLWHTAADVSFSKRHEYWEITLPPLTTFLGGGPGLRSGIGMGLGSGVGPGQGMGAGSGEGEVGGVSGRWRGTEGVVEDDAIAIRVVIKHATEASAPLVHADQQFISRRITRQAAALLDSKTGDVRFVCLEFLPGSKGPGTAAGSNSALSSSALGSAATARATDTEGAGRVEIVRKRVLYAHSEVLVQLDYFKSMLAGGFAESACPSGLTGVGIGDASGRREIIIDDAGYDTLYWLLRYIYTDEILFSPVLGGAATDDAGQLGKAESVGEAAAQSATQVGSLGVDKGIDGISAKGISSANDFGSLEYEIAVDGDDGVRSVMARHNLDYSIVRRILSAETWAPIPIPDGDGEFNLETRGGAVGDGETSLGASIASLTMSPTATGSRSVTSPRSDRGDRGRAPSESSDSPRPVSRLSATSAISAASLPAPRIASTATTASTTVTPARKPAVPRATSTSATSTIANATTNTTTPARRGEKPSGPAPSKPSQHPTSPRYPTSRRITPGPGTSSSTTTSAASGTTTTASPPQPPPDPHPHPPVRTPPPPHPLAIYTLAHRYAIDHLVSLAHLAILRRLTPRSCVPMLLATYAYPELHADVMAYITDNWSEVAGTPELDRCFQEVSAGVWGENKGGMVLLGLMRHLTGVA